MLKQRILTLPTRPPQQSSCVLSMILVLLVSVFFVIPSVCIPQLVSCLAPRVFQLDSCLIYCVPQSAPSPVSPCPCPALSPHTPTGTPFPVTSVALLFVPLDQPDSPALSAPGYFYSMSLVYFSVYPCVLFFPFVPCGLVPPAPWCCKSLPPTFG